MPEIARAVNTKGGAEYVVRVRDVPGVVRIEARKWPLGRYLLRKLREESGYGALQDSGGINPGFAMKLRELQSDLSIVGAYDLHEQKRLQSERKAKVLHSIFRSKKREL